MRWVWDDWMIEHERQEQPRSAVLILLRDDELAVYELGDHPRIVDIGAAVRGLKRDRVT